MLDNPYQAPQEIPQASPMSGQSALEKYRSQPMLGAVNVLLIGLVIVTRCAKIGTDVWLLRILESGAIEDPDVQSRFGIAEMAAMVGQLASYLLSALVFLFWLSYAYRNLRALHNNRSEYSRAMAVGGFFIPIANLVLGYRIIKELRLGSRLVDKFQSRSKHSLLVLGWWLLHLVSAAIVQVASAMANGARTVDDIPPAFVLEIFGLVLSILPGLFLIKIVRDVDRGGDELYAHLCAQEPAPEQPVQPAMDFGKFGKLEFPANENPPGDS